MFDLIWLGLKYGVCSLVSGSRIPWQVTLCSSELAFHHEEICSLTLTTFVPLYGKAAQSWTWVRSIHGSGRVGSGPVRMYYGPGTVAHTTYNTSHALGELAGSRREDNRAYGVSINI